jgi:hypothetical protein
MWDIVLRSLITTYLSQTLDALDKLHGENPLEIKILLILVLKITIIVGFPIFVMKFLYSNKPLLENDATINSYGSLYHRQRISPNSDEPLWKMPIFLLKRLLISLATIFFQKMPLI